MQFLKNAYHSRSPKNFVELEKDVRNQLSAPEIPPVRD